MRYFKKSEWAVESGATTTMKISRKYYGGSYEKTVTVGGDTVERTRIGDSVVHVRTTPAGMMAMQSSVFEYAHRDHLGSVEAVTDASGNELVVLGYDPYGKRRDNDWTARLTETEIETLLGAHGERVSRGFTGHEHLDRARLIHFNGGGGGGSTTRTVTVTTTETVHGVMAVPYRYETTGNWNCSEGAGCLHLQVC